MNCSVCERENREGAAFCDGCGSPLTQTCPACNAEVRPGARFCDTCGNQLAAAPADLRTQTPVHLAQKILRERKEIEGERRTVTVLFVDAKGFTPLSEQLDAEQVYSFIHGATDRMLAAVHRNEGTVTQFTGDGIMATFGAPIAHEDSARRAVAAALDMQRALAEYVEGAGVKTAFRCGLNTGVVVVGRIGDDLTMEYTAIGDTTNLAARMEQMCEPGAVYITENTHRDVADYIDCEDLGPLDVKGKAEPVRVYKAVAERAVKTRLDAAVARGLSPFLGRDRELEMLHGFWRDSLAGRGQIVLISGEPGIGKSRLLLEFHRSLADDVIWREAHCVSYGENIPYLPVVELVKSGFGITDSDDEGTIIARIDEDTAEWTPEAQKTAPYLKFLLQVDPGDAALEAMDPMQRRAGVLDSLRALILERAREAPRVVVVEDLHWADDQSEEAFRVSADVVAASPVLMILTFRPGYLHPSGDLPNAHRIVLNDLDAESRNELATAALEAADLSSDLALPVTHKAEGNPLFIEEVAKALGSGVTDASSVPNSLQDVILARIDRLERSARESLQLASVIGREFTLRLLNRISDLQSELEGVLGELKTLELIYEKTFFPELAYMFKHALTHDVAYSTLLVERRKMLHKVVAAAIEELYADRIAEHFETPAHHYEQAEEWEKALDYLDKSGDKSSAASANGEALAFYGRALAACERLGRSNSREAATIAEKRGFIGVTIGDMPAARESFERMLKTCEALDDAHGVAGAIARLGLVELFNHDFPVAEAHLRRALELGASFDDVRYFAIVPLAILLLVVDRHAEAEPFLAEAEQLYERVDDPFITGFLGEISGIVPNWKGDYAAAIEKGVAPPGEDVAQHVALSQLSVHWVGALAHCGLGEYEEAIRILTYVLEGSERIGDLFMRIRTLNSLGWVYAELQDLDTAWNWNMRCIDVTSSTSLPDPEVEMNARLNLGDILLARGQLDEAEKQFRIVERVYREPEPQEVWMVWRYGQHLLHSYGELWLARGDGAKALELADECLALAQRTESTKNVVKAQRLRGESLSAMGRYDEADVALRAATDVAKSLGNPVQLWKTYAAVGALRAAQGDTENARAGYADALRVIGDVASGLSDERLRSTFLGSQAVAFIRAKAG